MQPLSLLVVTPEVPDPGSPRAAARRVGRLVERLARLGAVRVVAAEAARSAAAADALHLLGVEVVAGGPSWTDAVWAPDSPPTAIVVTDLLMAARLVTAGPVTSGNGQEAAPLVVVIDHLPSADLAWAPPPHGDDDAGGRDLLVARLERHEREALGRASAVACWSPSAAAALRALGDGIDPVVLADAPEPWPHPRAFAARSGVLFAGSLSAGALAPDEAALRWVRDEVAPLVAAGRHLSGSVSGSVSVLGTDANPWRRHLGDLLGVVPRASWRDAVGRARVGVLGGPGGEGPTLAVEMAAAGTPFVADPALLDEVGVDHLASLLGASGAAEVAGRVVRLHDSESAWQEAELGLLEWAREQWTAQESPGSSGSPRSFGAVASLLRSAGVDVETSAGAASPGATTPAATTPAATTPGAATLGALDGRARERGHAAQGGGTLADVDPRQARFEELADVRPILERPWAHRILVQLGSAERYRLWRHTHAVEAGTVADRAREARALHPRPTVSLIVPVYESDPDLLDQALASVAAQSYDAWEVCAVDDGSASDEPWGVLTAWAERDERVEVRRLAENRGIAGASKVALEMATGEFVGLLDHDDTLHEDALFWVAKALTECPDVDLVYTDWERVLRDGTVEMAYLKPGWSPELLLAVNYLIHFTVVRRALLEEVGGWRPGFEGAQDFDLFLRLTERTDRVLHVPRPLYRWRAAPGSTAADLEAKPAADAAGRRAVSEALARRGLDADVLPGPVKTHFRVRYRRTSDPLVTVVIPTRDRVDLLSRCVEGVRERTDYRNVELLVVDNDSRDPETLEWLAAFGGRVVRYPHPFNYARQMNLGVLEARGDLVLMLNNDAVPVTEEWMSSLVEHAVRPEVGAVGARLRWPDGRAQHESITVADLGGPAANLDTGGGYYTWGNHVRECAAVTGACLMTRPGVFWGVGGFDERLRVAWNDVDFCLRVGERGWRVIYTPYAELTHAESSSRAALDPEADRELYESRWGPPGAVRDPFFHPGLDLLNPLLFKV